MIAIASSIWKEWLLVTSIEVKPGWFGGWWWWLLVWVSLGLWWFFFFVCVGFLNTLKNRLLSLVPAKISQCRCYFLSRFFSMKLKSTGMVQCGCHSGVKLDLNCKFKNCFKCSSEGINHKIQVVITVRIPINYFLKYVFSFLLVILVFSLFWKKSEH